MQHGSAAFRFGAHAFISADGNFVWFVRQVKAGSIFDNIIVTDDFETAKAFAEETWGKSKDAEKAMFDEVG